MSESSTSVPQHNQNGLALGACLSGVLAVVLITIVFFFLSGMTPILLAVLFGLVALVLGILALKRGQSRGMSITGIVLGSLTVLIALALIGFALLFVGAFVLGGQ